MWPLFHQALVVEARVVKSNVVLILNDYYKYLAGPFESLPEANVARAKFDGDGFIGAFVVAYQGDTRVRIEKATSSAHK